MQFSARSSLMKPGSELVSDVIVTACPAIATTGVVAAFTNKQKLTALPSAAIAFAIFCWTLSAGVGVSVGIGARVAVGDGVINCEAEYSTEVAVGDGVAPDVATSPITATSTNKKITLAPMLNFFMGCPSCASVRHDIMVFSGLYFSDQ